MSIASASGDAAKKSGEDAAELVRSAYEAIERHDLDAAKTKLDEAKGLNETQAYLWSTYGYYHYQLGELKDAVEDFRKGAREIPGTSRSL